MEDNKLREEIVVPDYVAQAYQLLMENTAPYIQTLEKIDDAIMVEFRKYKSDPDKANKEQMEEYVTHMFELYKKVLPSYLVMNEFVQSITKLKERWEEIMTPWYGDLSHKLSIRAKTEEEK